MVIHICELFNPHKDAAYPAHKGQGFRRMFSMKLILVTGGGGFLGYAIVRLLRFCGDNVRVLCRGDYSKLQILGAETVRGDIADRAIVNKAAQGCDAIVHTAAKVGVWGSYRDYYRTNVTGTIHLLDACRDFGITRFVYTSSPSVAYGPEGAAGSDESLPVPSRHVTAYSATKAEAERLVLAANGPQLATCALRPHLIWGPEDNHLVPRIVARARAGRLRIIGDGQNLIDSIYIDNAAYAHLLALNRLAPGMPLAGRVYFLSQGEPLPAAVLINRIVAAAGLPPVRQHISVKSALIAGAICEIVYRLCGIAAEPPLTRFLAHQLSSPHWFNIGAAQRDLGYRPLVSIDEGMDRLAAWFRAPVKTT
jgi:nucleoside-diphosphate-sugar epimerase